MAGLRANWRVPIVVRPLDRGLIALRAALIVFVVLAGALPTFRALGGSFTGHHAQWYRVAGALAAGAVLFVVLQLPVVGTRLDRLFARTRRRVAIACNHDDDGEHADGRLACRLTPEILRAPLFRYDQQHSAVSALAQACEGQDDCRHWFVEGRGGSGKTRMALLLVQTLIRDRERCELGARCFLYDFASSPSAQDAFLRRLATSRHDGAVVMVDNFQLVRSGVLRTTTRRLIDRPGPRPERLLVFLARPGEAWNLSPGADVRLLSDAKRGNRHLELAGPPAESVARCVSEFDPEVARLIRRLNEESIASAAQLHLAQVVARNRAVPPEVIQILLLLGGEPTASPPELVHLLAIITALSMHSGGFSRRELRGALRVAGRSPSAGAALRRWWRTAAAFRRLRRVGLVTTLHLDGTRYLFHEAIAELCIDRLAALPAFSAPFTTVGAWRMRRLRAAGDALGAWLRAIEIDDHAVAEGTFDAAMARGAYGRMARCLRRARDRYPLSGALHLQLAILLDRIGDFAGSRAEFTDDLVRELSPSSELAATLAASRIEAAHDDAAKAGLDALCAHPDRFVAIVGQYWKLHMAAHRGTFSSGELCDLAGEALSLIGARETHWRVYSLARMHFDSLRHHYLAGGTPAAAVAAPQRRAVGDFLSSRLPIYEALHVLYTQAHLVGHVLLPRLAIFGEPAGPADAALAGVAPEDVTSIGALAATARALYTRARDEFWQYGDREADYLRADLLNAAMIQEGADLDSLEVELHEYERFVVATGFADIASYPHLYFVRWHVLKYYALLLDPATRDARSADEYLAEAARHLRLIEARDSEVRNQYGLLRAALLSLLLRGVTEPFDAEKAAELGRRAASSGYAFEQRLVGHLNERRHIAPAHLRAIFRFYPVVHQ